MRKPNEKTRVRNGLDHFAAFFRGPVVLSKADRRILNRVLRLAFRMMIKGKKRVIGSLEGANTRGIAGLGGSAAGLVDLLLERIRI